MNRFGNLRTEVAGKQNVMSTTHSRLAFFLPRKAPLSLETLT